VCSFLYFLQKGGKYTHRGEVLKEAVKKSRYKISRLIKLARISRGTYYNHIQNADLSFEKLEMYGKIINYDFSADFPDMQRYIVSEPASHYDPLPNTIEEAIKEIVRLREKCRELTEKDELSQKYIKVLEEKTSK
jgi:hypothetical protein